MPEIIVIKAPVHRFGQGAKALKLIPDGTGVTRDLGVVKADGSYYPPDLLETYTKLVENKAVPTPQAIALIELAKIPVDKFHF